MMEKLSDSLLSTGSQIISQFSHTGCPVSPAPLLLGGSIEWVVSFLSITINLFHLVRYRYFMQTKKGRWPDVELLGHPIVPVCIFLHV